MKRLTLIGAAVGAALLGGLLLRAAGPATATGELAPPTEPTAVVKSPVPPPSITPPPARDVFRYEDEGGTRQADIRALVSSTPTTEPPPALAPPAPDPVRLVGFVRREGTWRAALSIHGDVVVLGVGDTSSGYQVVAIDQADGVTVRDPQGRERKLPLSEP